HQGTPTNRGGCGQASGRPSRWAFYTRVVVRSSPRRARRGRARPTPGHGGSPVVTGEVVGIDLLVADGQLAAHRGEDAVLRADDGVGDVQLALVQRLADGLAGQRLEDLPQLRLLLVGQILGAAADLAGELPQGHLRLAHHDDGVFDDLVV